MEALLTQQWIGDRGIDVRDEASLTLVREAIRALGARDELVDRAVLVASELGRNHLRHARFGEIAVRAIDRGIEIVAVDRGLGLTDVSAALDAAPRPRGSLGVGVSSVRRLASEVDIDVRLFEGTCFIARVLERDVPRRREVGVYGRPYPGEHVSGDHALFVRTDDALVLAVCDGLGHGPAARAAADAAMRYFVEHAGAAPATLLEGAHQALVGTRGVVMAALRATATELEVASVGNVDVQVVAPRSVRRFGGSSAVVGGRPGPVKPRGETAALAPDDVIVMSTDGLTSKLSIEHDYPLLRAHPVAIAQRILERFGRDNDDGLVLVAR
ncbi:MAG: SpoIIE family protein phosphatase [Labilithrix sp.]|nr:SpoIIE family protein phosphatase [Labilithrix sp.]MCW5812553.1 SpoIIE family protein phosphatase [Labilithrix sp.]